jgi:hypothetical protein
LASFLDFSNEIVMMDPFRDFWNVMTAMMDSFRDFWNETYRMTTTLVPWNEILVVPF